MERITVTPEELEVFSFYFVLPQEDRRFLCNMIIDQMLLFFKYQINEDWKPSFLNLIEVSLEYHTEESNYELCQILTDIRNILNEPTD